MTVVDRDIVQRRVTVGGRRAAKATAAEPVWTAPPPRSKPACGVKRAALVLVGLHEAPDPLTTLREDLAARRRLAVWCMRGLSVISVPEAAEAVGMRSHGGLGSWMSRAHAWPGPETPAAVLATVWMLRNLRSGARLTLPIERIVEAYQDISWATPRGAALRKGAA